MTEPIEDSAGRCIRTLLSLAHVELRVRWFAEQIRTRNPNEFGTVLDLVVGASEVAEPKAREALMTVALWVAGNASDKNLHRLRQAAIDLRLLSLQRLLRRLPAASTPPDSREERIPDYGTGRELTLGERRSLARCSDRSRFDALLRDPHPMVIRQLLINPKMTETDVLRVSAHRPARPALIEAIASTSWLARRRVRLSVLFNPGSPLGVTVPLIGLSTRDELQDLTRGADLPALVRVTATELLERRPPVWALHNAGTEAIH